MSAASNPPPARQRARRAMIALYTGVALIFMGLSAYRFRPGGFDDLREGFIFFFTGALLLGLALGIHRWLSADEQPEILPDSEKKHNRPIRWQPVILGWMMVLLVTQVNTLAEVNAIDWRLLWEMSPHIQMALFFGGLSLMIWGIDGAPRLRWPVIHLRRYHGLLLLILLVGAVARLVNLEEGVHRFLDELHYANAVVRLWEGENIKIFHPFSTVTAFSWFFAYAQQWTTWITGPGLTGLRLVSVGAGLLQVAAVYWVGKLLFDRKVGLLAALILATLPVHIHFSRIGINNIADPLMGVLAMGFLARGFRYGRLRDYALAGLFLGLTQYFYEGGRLFYLVFLVAWLAWLSLFHNRRDPVFHFPAWRELLAFTGMLIVVMTPFYFTWFVQNFDFTPRYQAMGIRAEDWSNIAQNSDYGPLRLVLDKMVTPLMGFVQKPDTSWFYSGEMPFVLPAFTIFFLLGVAYAFWRIRKPGGSLLFWWLLGVAAGNSLIVDSLSAPRYLVVFPAVALLMAVGICYTLSLLLAFLPEHVNLGQRPLNRAQILSALAAVTALVIGVHQINYYLGTHLPNYYTYVDKNFDPRDRDGRRLRDVEDALFRAVAQPPDTHVHLISSGVVWDFDVRTMILYYDRVEDLKISHMYPEAFTAAYLEDLQRDMNHAFFIDYEDADSYRLIQQYFDVEGPTFSPHHIPEDSQFVLYYASNIRNLFPPDKVNESD